jgi:hemolysin III
MTSQGLFSIKEEIANAITHGIGALLAMAALVILIVLASFNGTAWHIVGFLKPKVFSGNLITCRSFC